MKKPAKNSRVKSTECLGLILLGGILQIGLKSAWVIALLALVECGRADRGLRDVLLQRFEIVARKIFHCHGIFSVGLAPVAGFMLLLRNPVPGSATLAFPPNDRLAKLLVPVPPKTTHKALYG
jgi:hypothetical protein